MFTIANARKTNKPPTSAAAWWRGNKPAMSSVATRPISRSTETKTSEIPQAAVIDGTGAAQGLDLEALPLDRLVGFDGKPLKDVSHEGSRLFQRQEILRILRAEVK